MGEATKQRINTKMKYLLIKRVKIKLNKERMTRTKRSKKKMELGNKKNESLANK
jgi:hypothetical protein